VIDFFRNIPRFKKRLLLAIALSQPRARQTVYRVRKKTVTPGTTEGRK